MKLFKTALVPTTLLLVFVSSTMATQEKPNIVIIMSDDMGYSDIGCFGGEIRTPHLDSLANSGLRFTNFYSENMCWVSRAAMLTGVYHKSSLRNSAIHPHCETIPEALRRNGYATKMSGKWHLAGKPYRIYPVDRGYDEFYGILGGAASFYAPAHLTRNKKNIDSEAIENPDYYLTDAISDEAVRMINETEKEKPLFLSVAYTAAHWPLHARESDVAKYKGAFAIGWDELRKQRLERMKEMGIVPSSLELSPRHPSVPAWKNEENPLWQQRRMEVYAAQITVMDEGIGRIIKALKSNKRFDNTLILFSIDNGGCHVEYGPNRKGDYLPKTTRDGKAMKPGNLPSIMPGPENTYQSYGYGWANTSNTPYRYFKQYDHEGGIRTSMIAHWPTGIRRKGALVRSVTHLVDIHPTIMDITGIKPSEQRIPVDGISFRQSFGKTDHQGRNTMFFDHNKGRAYREGNWKAVAIKAKKKFNWELYDLHNDPLELNNLAKKHSQKLSDMVSKWKEESARHVRQSRSD